MVPKYVTIKLIQLSSRENSNSEQKTFVFKSASVARNFKFECGTLNFENGG